MKIRHRKPGTARSLTASLAAAFLALSVVVLLISSGVQTYANIRAQQELIFNQQILLAQNAAATVSSFVQNHFQLLESAIRLDNPVAMSTERQRVLLQTLLGLRTSFRQVILLDSRDQILARTSRHSLATSEPIRDQIERSILGRVRNREKVISPVYIDDSTNEPLVLLAVPITDFFVNYTGVLVAEMNLKFMWNLVDTLTMGENGHAYVVDRKGDLIAFPDIARVLKGENVSHLQSVADFIHNPSPSHAPRMSTYPGVTGKVVVGTYVALETPEWAVVTEQPWKEAYRETIRNALTSTSVTLAMAISASILGWYFARRLAVPIIHLTETATRIAGGERDLQAAVEGPREVAGLAAAFNSMTAQLGQSMDSLEKRVVEVTRAEESLREAHATLQALFDHSPVSIIILDPEGRVLLWNHAAEKMYGWPHREVIGKPLPTVTEEEFEPHLAICARVMAGEPFYDIEAKRKRKDGSTVYVNLSAVCLRNADGKPYAIMGVGVDITERKRAQNALRESEELFRAIFEQAAAGVALVTPENGRFVRVNQRYCDFLGYSREELLQLAVRHVTLPEDMETAMSNMERLRRQELHTYALERRFLRKDGTVVWGRIAVSSIPAPGALHGAILAVVQDITGRKRAEEALRYSEELLRESQALSHVGSWDWDLSTGTRVLSDEMYRILGYEPGSFVPTAQHFADSIHPMDKERVLNAFRNATETGAPYKEEFRIIRPDGSERVLRGEGFLRRDSSGRPHRMIGSSMDITEIRQAEIALRESEQRFRMVVQNANAILFTLDANGVFLLSEGLALAKLGLLPGQAVGKSAYELFRDRPVITESIRQALAGTLTQATTEIAGVFFDTIYSVIYTPDGQVGGLMGLALDVTERKRAEEALQRSEERLRLALMAANQGLWDLDLQTGQAQVNPDYERMLGYEPGSIILTLSSWSEMLHPEDRNMVFEYLDSYLSGRVGYYRIEFRQRTKSGDYKWLLSLGKIVSWDTDGRPLRMLGTHTDIDERKHTEKALSRTQFCLDHSKDAVFWIRNDASLVYVNEAACRSLGYTREELLSLSIPDIDPLFPRERWDESWAHTNMVGSDVIETLHQTKDGKMFPVEISVDVLRFEGEIMLSAFARDISERREAQRLLQEREAKLTSIFRAAPVGICRLVNGVIQEVNDTLCLMTGYSPEELEGRHTRMLYTSDREYVSLSCEDGLPAGGFCTGTIETEWKHKDGTVREIALRSTPLDLSDPRMGSIFTALDITERKRIERAVRESEALLQKSQQVARLGSYYFDSLTGKWLSSATLDDIFGIDEGFIKDVQGWLEIAHPAEQEGMREYLENHVIAGHNSFDREYRIVRQNDGQVRWVHGLGELEFDETGRTIKMIGTIQDITERKTAQEKVRELNEELEDRVLQRTAQLEAAVKELEAFTYSVSHDLRAPLRAMNGFSRILMEDHFEALDEEGRRVCGIIYSEAGRMARLVDDLLAYSRMGRAEMVPVRIDMESLVHSVFHELTTPEERERIDFRVEPLPPALSDRTMCYQIWSNLIGNAVKFTSTRERAVIEVGAERKEKETTYFVRDNGAGFDMKYAKKLFGVFQRLHSEREFAGTGVGLAIVQRLVHRHGGRTWAEGEPDRGATFYFVLPPAKE